MVVALESWATILITHLRGWNRQRENATSEVLTSFNRECLLFGYFQQRQDEMETSMMHPKAPRLTVEEENALVSQVLEIIGGITMEALQTLDQSEERDMWSMEEGDDNVFYSDDDQTHQDTTEDTCCDGSGKVSERLVKSAAAEAKEDVSQSTGDSGGDNLEKERETTLSVKEDRGQELQMSKTEFVSQSEGTDPEAEAELSPENSVSSSGKPLQPKCMNKDMETQPEGNTPSESGKKSLVL